MQTTKLSLANIQAKLSRTEMKNIMAGRDPIGGDDRMQCICKNGSIAGMVSCDTCESYCSTDHAFGGKDICS